MAPSTVSLSITAVKLTNHALRAAALPSIINACLMSDAQWLINHSMSPAPQICLISIDVHTVHTLTLCDWHFTEAHEGNISVAGANKFFGRDSRMSYFTPLISLCGLSVPRMIFILDTNWVHFETETQHYMFAPQNVCFYVKPAHLSKEGDQTLSQTLSTA